MRFSRDITLEQMMTEWPETVAVLMRYRMLCVGCPVSGFHTPVDAVREHEADMERFEKSLIDAIGGKSL
jgi:hybrid cluster-associated redox disulfide protein